uniref:(northern house mosquito) hypothetical protein n=1 Tax=Culex pipiens TaxID=7175 RepID=A0A8D8B904_CULPI
MASRATPPRSRGSRANSLPPIARTSGPRIFFSFLPFFSSLPSSMERAMVSVASSGSLNWIERAVNRRLADSMAISNRASPFSSPAGSELTISFSDTDLPMRSTGALGSLMKVTPGTISMLLARAARFRAVIPFTAKQVPISSASRQLPKYLSAIWSPFPAFEDSSAGAGAAMAQATSTAVTINTFMIILLFVCCLRCSLITSQNVHVLGLKVSLEELALGTDTLGSMSCSCCVS